jgi:hypothetical protein
MVLEALRNVPTTAHILGGAVIGASPENGVVDTDSHGFGYQNMLVCDGSTVPANPGVNPALVRRQRNSEFSASDYESSCYPLYSMGYLVLF